jgi:pSer/pThr/pTyr-binding forkhead associated (FHA) protein
MNDEENVMTKAYKLILKSGPNAETEFPMEKDELFLGRDVNNDIVINDPEVSRRHARLSRQGEDYIYEDLGSTNGSFVLGQRVVSPIFLTTGTVITIGERVIIAYEIEIVDPGATVVVARRTESVIQPAPEAQESLGAQVPPLLQAVTPPPVQSVMSPSPVMPPVSGFEPSTSPSKKPSKGLIVALIILGIILVFCIIPWVIVELTNSYCSLLPGFFNAIQPGSCL